MASELAWQLVWLAFLTWPHLPARAAAAPAAPAAMAAAPAAERQSMEMPGQANPREEEVSFIADAALASFVVIQASWPNLVPSLAEPRPQSRACYIRRQESSLHGASRTRAVRGTNPALQDGACPPAAGQTSALLLCPSCAGPATPNCIVTVPCPGPSVCACPGRHQAVGQAPAIQQQVGRAGAEGRESGRESEAGVKEQGLRGGGQKNWMHNLRVSAALVRTAMASELFLACASLLGDCH